MKNEKNFVFQKNFLFGQFAQTKKPLNKGVFRLD